MNKIDEVKKRLDLAEKSSGYLITVSFYNSEDRDEISHMWYESNYKKEDLASTLDHLKATYIKCEEKKEEVIKIKTSPSDDETKAKSDKEE